ncbi:ABC transporter substrate-binding protein [Rhodococcus globerulus]|uniref:ABC transporter substrate-binding protein n=1 Tax=Rhodococcus globerulus TaxID=33008 RepID=UPI001F361608|nr:ABC transporter substrate-binding protein [Rhodococcus globerulus]MCE4268574.1 ABC transporter substrate-binding protein [Rhodococcus globerulus]
MSKSESVWFGGAGVRRAIIFSAVGLTALASVTACAGSGADSASGAGGACNSPGVTADKITIASVSPLSGPAASTFAGFVEGAKARFAVENEKGGVNGRTLELVTNDDLGDGAAQVTAARNAVQSQKAFGILHASRVDTMFDYLSAQNVPVTGYPGQPAYQEKMNAFGYAGASLIGFYSTSMAQFMQDKGVTKLGVLANNSTGSKGGADGLVKTAGQIGLEVAATSFDIPIGAFDATSVAIQMKDAGVDGLYMPLVTDSSISVLKAMAAQGVKLKATEMQGLYDPKITAQVGDLLQGVSGAGVGIVPIELDNESTNAFVDAMNEYGDGVDPRTGFTGPGYISADLFIEGLKKAGDCPTRDAFISELHKVSDYEGAGLLIEPANFASGLVPAGTPYGRCNWLVTYEGNAFVPEPEATCGEVVN